MGVLFELFVNEAGEFEGQAVHTALTLVLGDEGFELSDTGFGQEWVVVSGADFAPRGWQDVLRVLRAEQG